MRDAGVRKILFSSTAATYGFHAEMPLREDSPQTPETPYGTTKLAAEWLIKDYARAYGLGYTLLRYFNASGADPDGDFGEDRRHESHLIPLILQVAVGRRPKVLIYGEDYPTRDGTCVRDYVHTDDLAQAHQLAVEVLEPGMRRAYNLGSGTGATVLEVLRACEETVGRPIAHEVVGRRPGDPAVLIASSGEDHQGTGLVAALHRHSRHRPDRLGVAPPPSPRLRSRRSAELNAVNNDEYRLLDSHLSDAQPDVHPPGDHRAREPRIYNPPFRLRRFAGTGRRGGSEEQQSTHADPGGRGFRVWPRPCSWRHLERPWRWWKALAMAVRLGLRSERGFIRHLIYLAEACRLRHCW